MGALLRLVRGIDLGYCLALDGGGGEGAPGLARKAITHLPRDIFSVRARLSCLQRWDGPPAVQDILAPSGESAQQLAPGVCACMGMWGGEGVVACLADVLSRAGHLPRPAR